MTKSTRNLALSLLALIVLSPAPEPAAAQDGRPNVVLVFMDNFGWGELGVYGGGVLRGAPTPRRPSWRPRHGCGFRSILEIASPMPWQSQRTVRF